MEAKNRLITIPPSHFCEKAKWGLDFTGIPYIEEPHAPGFHKFHTTSLGGSSTPVLVTADNVAYTQSAAILQFASDHSVNGVKLYGNNDEEREQIKQLEELFDNKLGPATRRFVYFHILDLPVALGLLTDNVPYLESTATSVGFFAVRQMMKSGLDIYEPGAKESLEVINQIFDQINELIKDGRQFLVGNCLSAADIAFASFVSPVVLPEEHRIYKKYESQFPKDVMGLVLQKRHTPAGEFALQLYKKWRYHDSKL